MTMLPIALSIILPGARVIQPTPFDEVELRHKVEVWLDFKDRPDQDLVESLPRAFDRIGGAGTAQRIRSILLALNEEIGLEPFEDRHPLLSITDLRIPMTGEGSGLRGLRFSTHNVSLSISLTKGGRIDTISCPMPMLRHPYRNVPDLEAARAQIIRFSESLGHPMRDVETFLIPDEEPEAGRVFFAYEPLGDLWMGTGRGMEVHYDWMPDERGQFNGYRMTLLSFNYGRAYLAPRGQSLAPSFFAQRAADFVRSLTSSGEFQYITFRPRLMGVPREERRGAERVGPLSTRLERARAENKLVGMTEILLQEPGAQTRHRVVLEADSGEIVSYSQLGGGPGNRASTPFLPWQSVWFQGQEFLPSWRKSFLPLQGETSWVMQANKMIRGWKNANLLMIQLNGQTYVAPLPK